MKIYLHGHENKYAVEQMLLTLYPNERPEYPGGTPTGDRIEISRRSGGTWLTVTAKLVSAGEAYIGSARHKIAELNSELLLDRYTQRMIKTAFYRAYLRAGNVKPAWGSLTGVRPTKLMTALLDSGASPAEALRDYIDEFGVTPLRAKLCLDASLATVSAEKSLSSRDICLYVGIPFCPTRCDYCSFVSQSVEKSMKLIPPFLDALYREIAATAEVVRHCGLRVISVYMGGGTPTTLSAPQLDTLCTLLAESFDLSALREYTVEAGRPDTITREKLEVLRRHGVDRISVNPQTMCDRVLSTIGRRHTAADILSALNLVRQVGGFAVNMDLIAGLRSDTPADFEATVKAVLALSPENITVHTLSMKKGSRLTLEGSDMPPAEEVGQMLDFAINSLKAADYSPYYLYRQKFMAGGFENIGWCKKGYESLYNICIMEELCGILAMGGGGSTKLVAPGDGRNLRLMAPKYPTEYISHIEKIMADKIKIKEFYNGISAK